MATKFMTSMIIFALQFMIIRAETQPAQTIAHSGRGAVSIFTFVGEGRHHSNEEFVRACYVACRKSSAMLLVQTDKKFVANNLLFQAPCQPAFIYKIDGIISAPQNPEREKNTDKWVQFAKVDSFTMMGRGLINGEGEKLWAGERKLLNEQRSVATMDRMVKGSTRLEPPKPEPLRGSPAHHN